MRLGRVSVVMMASEKASPPSLLSSIAATPAWTFSIGSWRPMIPVEEQSTISFSSFNFCATSSVMRYAFNRPTSPVAQFALPLFTITACALPLFRRSWQTSTGAARVLLGVNVPLATQGTLDAKIARSGIDLSDLMPQDVMPARKPCGAVTQFSISRKISGNARTSSECEYCLYRKKFLVPGNCSQSNVANPKLGTENWERGTRCLPPLYNVEPEKHNPHWSHEVRIVGKISKKCLTFQNKRDILSFQRCIENT